MKYWVAILALLALSSPARADWYEASSEHFVIYADDREKDIRRFAENLERYHSAMAFVLNKQLEAPSPSSRVVIFVVGGQRDIRELAGTESKTIAGFYVPRAGASRAFVQDIRNKKGYPSFSTTVLLHEYAHHFLISTTRFAMPRWMSEGAAEFFAAASFNGNGTVQIGRPAQHRGMELAHADEVTVEQLLDQELYESTRRGRYDAFYGRSWALYHMLTFSDERSGQLGEYWLQVARGTPSIEAGRAVFGDLDELDRELDNYLRQKRMMNFVLQPDMIQIAPVSIRKLSEGEEAIMSVRMRSQRGVDDETAQTVVADARAVAAQYPDDAGVLTALAEAEFDAGNDDAAIAAADAAITLDASRKNAYVQKGYALFRKAEEADDEDAAFKAAMIPFSQLNALENDHPLPLIYFYRSFIQRGAMPSENARHALARAYELAPFDKNLGMSLGLMYAGDGQITRAMNTLRPLSSDPHGGGLVRAAKRYLGQLQHASEGEPWWPSAIDADVPMLDESADED
ncbi:DUF1570 domain-containing protein [Erythrobacter aquimaris]|uniref:DUF1570 domain-containing protein n=1 Tax=Qipengyuania aquimaris TaxID=255984 RepID=A0A6I4TIM7_9SPHN|nr:DUF1570 domain-containing protein [Qipengyuania aquimaris]MXO95079.1 DUF1570 domain-containing protein [Qipengyuania aquimaris]